VGRLRSPARAARCGIAVAASAVLLCLAGPALLRAQQPGAAAPDVYVVQPGDTLAVIARRYGLDYRDVAAWNDISNPALIRVGQRLRLSPPGAALGTAEAAAAPVERAAAAPGRASTPITSATAAGNDAELQRLRNTTSELIVLLLQQGLITREKAQALMEQAQLGPLPEMAEAPAPVAEEGTAPAAEGAAPRRRARPPAEPAEAAAEAAPEEAGVVRVPYVPEVVKNEIRDQIREEVIAQAKSERWAEPGSLPEWLDRITWEGDIRLRYQGDYYSEDNIPAPIYNAVIGNDLDNTTEDEQRFRYRARLGLLAKISEKWGAGFRITSGNTTNPVSTNQTLGSYNNRSAITLDRAYLRWEPSPRWVASGGRIPNPYFSSDLLWDEDLTFEGFAGSFKPQFRPGWNGFLTAGYYLVEFGESSAQTPDPDTKTLIGLQAGTDLELGSRAKLKLGLAWYGYQNIEGQPNTTLFSEANNWTAPAFRQKGNTVFNIDNDGDPNTNLYALASKFEILNLTAAADLAYFEPYVVRVSADYAKNLGFDRGEIEDRTGFTLEDATTAYKLGLTFGKEGLNNFGDWQAFFSYRYLEGDSVLDAFADSDFHLGGTDAKGYEIGGTFAFDRRVWMRLRWLSADEIDGPPLEIDVLQLDLNARF
jgi:LysM repeat protein